MRLVEWLEKGIKVVLIGMMMLTLLAGTVELGVILYQQLMKPPFLLLDITEMLEVFGFFLMILIGLELLETIKVYIKEDKIHTEVVFLVAMIAIARKVIILDLEKYPAVVLYGIAAIIFALAAGYYLFRRALTNRPEGGLLSRSGKLD
ncbi:MAG: phosphate-starvation-inducible PsiE family protein [Desulfarculus sp.]|nr:phosphate-starvation-inducible PsiE family protein [Desulfarculus sp.]